MMMILVNILLYKVRGVNINVYVNMSISHMGRSDLTASRLGRGFDEYEIMTISIVLPSCLHIFEYHILSVSAIPYFGAFRPSLF